MRAAETAYRMASVKGCTSAPQERAPVCTDPQIAALANGLARGGSASFEVDVKAAPLTPASPLTGCLKPSDRRWLQQNSPPGELRHYRRSFASTEWIAYRQR
jgi:hypothetical protein